jgi:hypothetical protein
MVGFDGLELGLVVLDQRDDLPAQISHRAAAARCVRGCRSGGARAGLPRRDAFEQSEQPVQRSVGALQRGRRVQHGILRRDYATRPAAAWRFTCNSRAAVVAAAHAHHGARSGGRCGERSRRFLQAAASVTRRTAVGSQHVEERGAPGIG